MDIAYNKESKRKTPAIIAFHDGERFFGDEAATVGLRFPSKSFHHLVDLLGKSIDNPVVIEYQKRFPYYEIEADPERNNTILFKADGVKYSVEELVAQMLLKASEFTIEPARKFHLLSTRMFRICSRFLEVLIKFPVFSYQYRSTRHRLCHCCTGFLRPS